MLPSNAPTFSVIIPNYNNAATLARAIRSVQAQTYPAHEIIVIDDGSTDHSAAVASEFAGSIVYIHQKNAGVALARNNGARFATGEWLAFLDADDEFAPDRLEAHATWIQDEPDIDFLLADQEARDTSGKLLGTIISACKAGRKLLAAHPGAERVPLTVSDFEDLAADGFMEIRTISIPRQTFVGLGGFPAGHKIGEDLHLFLRLLANSRKAGVVMRSLATYHIYPTSAMRKNPVQAAQNFVQSVESLHLELTNAPSPVLNGYLAKRHAVRLSLAYAYLRAQRKPAAVGTMLKSFFQLPNARTFRDILSVARGFRSGAPALPRDTSVA